MLWSPLTCEFTNSNGPANSTITVAVPNTVKCTGANNACIIRFNNGGPDSGSLANGAGPFGGCVAVSQASAANTKATGKGANNAAGKGANNAAAQAGGRHRVMSRHFYPSVKAREAAVAELERRQKLTAQLIDELKVR